MTNSKMTCQITTMKQMQTTQADSRRNTKSEQNQHYSVMNEWKMTFRVNEFYEEENVAGGGEECNSHCEINTELRKTARNRDT